MRKAIITMGLPASGKSTTVEKMCLSEYIKLDSDAIKEEHPCYDPKQPELLHEWSKWELKKRISETIESGEDLVIDTTGTNTEKLYQYLLNLKKHGYNVTLVYCIVSVENCIKRNATRPRTVPQRIIEEKSKIIDFSFNSLKTHFDNVLVFDNN